MIELVLTIIGRDRAGIAAKLADVVTFHEGDWQHSEIAELAGRFAGVVVVSVPEQQVDELLTALLILREQGLHVTAEQADTPVAAPDRDDLHLCVTGDDRRGTVKEISAALGELGISMVRMGTVTGLDGERFEFNARLSVPDGVEPDKISAALAEVAESLDIDYHLDNDTD